MSFIKKILIFLDRYFSSIFFVLGFVTFFVHLFCQDETNGFLCVVSFVLSIFYKLDYYLNPADKRDK